MSDKTYWAAAKPVAFGLLLSMGWMWQAVGATAALPTTAPDNQSQPGVSRLLNSTQSTLGRLRGGTTELTSRLGNGQQRLLQGLGRGSNDLLEGAGRGSGDLLAGLGNGSNDLLSATGSGLDTLQSNAGSRTLMSWLAMRRLMQGLMGQHLDPIPDDTATFETALEWQGVGRTSRYITPAIVDDQSQAPAIVLLHFGYGTPDRMANLTHIAELVSKTGAWVILPSAVDNHWQESPLVEQTNDDVGYLDAVIQDAIDHYPIDPKRIYMAGMSNGGFMTNRFLCQHPQRIAAAAIVAASQRTLRRRECPAGDNLEVPMLIIDGTEDPIVPYDGRYGLLSVPETFNYWLNRNGCDPEATVDSDLPDVADDGTTVSERDNASCKNDSGVRLLTVNQGGHAWPGGEEYMVDEKLGKTSQDISASDQLWQFFQSFQRP